MKVPAAAKVALLTACFFWAASFIATKVALKHCPPLTVVTIRLIISSLCFLIWMVIKRVKIKTRGGKWWLRLFLLSLFGTGLHYGTQTVGIGYTTAANASLYAATGPISITLIAAVFLREKITFRKGLGIFIALGGVLWVMGPETLLAFELKGHLLGDSLVFFSIFLWGLFTVFSKDTVAETGAIPLTAMVTFIGSITMVPIGIWESTQRQFSIFHLPIEAWLAIGFLGITCSFLATLLYVNALEQVESQKVGVYLYLIPPLTYIIAALVLKEVIGWNLLIGSAIVIGGVYLTERG